MSTRILTGLEVKRDLLNNYVYRNRRHRSFAKSLGKIKMVEGFSINEDIILIKYV